MSYLRIPETMQAEIRELLEHLSKGYVDTPLKVNGECFCAEPDCICIYMTLTVACNEEATEWSYQTGDNSFTGGAYLNRHWAVVDIAEDFDVAATLAEIVDQLDTLIHANS